MDSLWSNIISKPNNIDSYPLQYLSGYDICSILKMHPHLIFELDPYLDHMCGDDLSELLQAHPILIDLRNDAGILLLRRLHVMDGYDLCALIKECPFLLPFFSHGFIEDRLYGPSLCDLLDERPELIDKLPSLKTLVGNMISCLIISCPELIHNPRIDLDKMEGRDIGAILEVHPKLLKELYKYLGLLTGEHIYFILREQPELEELIPSTNKIPIVYQEKLLKMRNRQDNNPRVETDI